MHAHVNDMWQPRRRFMHKTLGHTGPHHYLYNSWALNNPTHLTIQQHLTITNSSQIWLSMGNTTKVFLALCLCFMVGGSLGQLSIERRLSYSAQQCRLNRITSNEPSRKIECEGGLIEVWDENDEQFQCSGIDARKVTIQPNSLTLPSFHPFPRLVYIQQGEGILGVSYPGCPETYHSTSRRGEFGRRGGREGDDQTDLHQKVHRFRAGDILAIPPGAVHWCYNDGNEDVVSIVVNDLNNRANQLDQNFRASFLAGGLIGRSSQRGSRERRGEFQQFQNIFSAFDSELMAEAFNVPEDLIRRMQQTQDRSLIVRAEKGQMRILGPRSSEEEEADEYERRQKYMGLDMNGLEETVCTMRLRYNLDNRREADVFSRRGGRLNVVNEHKLPILKELDMSAEKGHMFPNTIYSPHWAMNSHSAVYVTQGDAQVQIVGNNGETIMDDTVREGEMFVIPQFFTSICKAGNGGFEYVSFKLAGSPMKSPLVGYTSVFRAMPLQVISNSFRISPSEALELKFGRQHQTLFLSPQAKSSRRS